MMLLEIIYLTIDTLNKFTIFGMTRSEKYYLYHLYVYVAKDRFQRIPKLAAIIQNIEIKAINFKGMVTCNS